MYITSKNINVFPLNKSRSDDPQDNLLYESNIANIIRQLIDTDGFIISAPESINNISESTPLVLNLYGYYIKITALPSTHTGSLYISLNLTEQGSLQEIDGQDAEGEYTGVNILNSKPETGPYLYVYDYNGNLVSSSFNKFKSSALNISGIDGKH